MKTKELMEFSADELRHREGELVDQLFKLRFQKSLGQLESPMKIKAAYARWALMRFSRRRRSVKYSINPLA